MLSCSKPGDYVRACPLAYAHMIAPPPAGPFFSVPPPSPPWWHRSCVRVVAYRTTCLEAVCWHSHAHPGADPYGREAAHAAVRFWDGGRVVGTPRHGAGGGAAATAHAGRDREHGAAILC